ncbi:MAG: hypothetical protein ACYC96_13435 [Fimbriimonadaceae bacterium]
MMLRKMLALVVGVGLFGCGAQSPSIVGTWVGKYSGNSLTLKAKPDSSFTISGASQLYGRWESSGSDVRLFRDVRNGGDIGFGDGGDGAIHFKLAKDGKHLNGVGADGTPFSFTKK